MSLRPDDSAIYDIVEHARESLPGAPLPQIIQFVANMMSLSVALVEEIYEQEQRSRSVDKTETEDL